MGDPRLDGFYNHIARKHVAIGRLKELGYGSITSFIEAHPGESYINLSKPEFGLSVMPIVLLQQHAIEGVAQNRVRRLCMEMFVRFAREHLPNGWVKEKAADLDFHTAGVMASLTGALRTARAYQTDYERAQCCWNRLLELSPPIGWLPKDIDDPVIEKIFEDCWPENESVIRT